jgi:dipeptide/tripeptide permease
VLSVLAFFLTASTDWSRAWVIPMLTLMTLGDLSVIVLGVKAARRRKLPVAAALLIVNFLSVLGLTRLASVDQTRATQWIEQLGNTAGNGCFAAAWWMIGRVSLSRALSRPAHRRK